MCAPTLPQVAGLWPRGLPHSPLGGSVEERRQECPYSLKAELPYYIRDEIQDEEDLQPDPDAEPGQTSQRDIGTENHRLAAEVLNGARLSDLLDPDDREYSRIEWYVGRCRYMWQEAERVAPGQAIYIVERSVDLSGIHPAKEKGSIDFGVLVPGEWAWINDMKNCYNPVTPAARNYQMADYAIGTMDTFGVKRVKVSISNTISLWDDHHTYEPAELVNVRERLRQGTEACLSPWAPCRYGLKWCRYCKGYLECPVTVNLAAPPAIPTEKDIADMSREEVCRIYRRAQGDDIKALIQFIGEAKNRVTAWTAKGVSLIQYGIGTGNGKKKRVFVTGVGLKKLQEIGTELDKPIDKLMVRPRAKLASVAGVEKIWGKSKEVKAAMADLILELPGKPTPIIIPLPSGQIERGDQE